MPTTVGLGNGTADTRARIQQRLTGEEPPVRLPAARLEGPPQTSRNERMQPHFSGLGNLLNTVTSQKGVQQFFLETSKEGSKSLILPESSVILGRSITSYKRGGWLELQERLPEEVTVAAIWMFGVDALRHIFEKAIKPRIATKQQQHLSTDIAWDRAWSKAKHVDLSPQELFTRNQEEIIALLKIKSVRWAFSVGLALAGVGYIIPKANQWKTNLVLRHLNRRKRQTEGSNVQFGDPNAQRANIAGSRMPIMPKTPQFAPQTSPQTAESRTTSGIPLTFNTPASRTSQTPANQPTQNPVFPYSSPLFASNFSGSINPQVGAPHSQTALPFSGQNQPRPSVRNSTAGPVKFGGIADSLLQGVGHLVEQTPYGSILVVDAGIAGGRGYVASKRSLFETAEVLFRDIGSLYFYILSTPHIMKAATTLFDKAFKTSSHLEPQIATTLLEKLDRQLKKSGKPYTYDALKHAIQGADAHLVMAPAHKLKHAMQKGSREDFLKLLQKEANVYLGKGKAISLPIPALQTHYLTGSTIEPKNIQRLLDAIQQGKTHFSQFSTEERRNLGTAVKQAFRHTVGAEVDISSEAAIKANEHFKNLFQNPALQDESALLWKRIRNTVQMDSMDQAHSMLRRSLNVLRGAVPPGLIQEGEALADWLDQGINRKYTFKHLIQEKIQPKGLAFKDSTQAREHIVDLMQRLAQKAGFKTPEHKLVSHYQKAIQTLLGEQKGRLFSLATDAEDTILHQKLKDMLKGGLQNNGKLVNKALDIMGQLETDSRKLIDPGKTTQMRESIIHYTEKLLETLNHSELKGTFQKEVKQFANRSRNLHYGARILAVSGTMLCLGWLVPHLQTLLTKKLTGHDKNPGIEHAQKLFEPDEGTSKKPDYHPTKPLSHPLSQLTPPPQRMSMSSAPRLGGYHPGMPSALPANAYTTTASGQNPYLKPNLPYENQRR